MVAYLISLLFFTALCVAVNKSIFKSSSVVVVFYEELLRGVFSWGRGFITHVSTLLPGMFKDHVRLTFKGRRYESARL